MTLRQSNRKISPAIGLLRSTLSKNTGVIILMSIAMLIFCPGFLLAALSKINLSKLEYTSPEMLDAVYAVTTVLSCILVCIGNYVNFAFLYKKSSSDVFGALPLTRNALLFSRAAASFIGVLIPVTIGYVSLLLLRLHYPAVIIGTIAQISSAYFMNIMFMMAFSAFSLFFIICAGSGFDLVVSFFGFNAATAITALIIQSLCENHLSGYASAYTGIIRALSPIYYMIECGYNFSDNAYSLQSSLYVLFDAAKMAVIFLILSFILYNYRKAERGEQAYAYKFIYAICGVLAGICGGYALSQIFVYGADTKEFSVIGITSFIAGALITTVVYGAVSERGFKTFKKSIVLGGVSVLAYGIVAVIIATGAFGYETRLPEEKKIVSATVDFDDANVDFTDSKYALALHKAIIERKADDEYLDTADTPHTYVRIFYYLDEKGDEVFNREYFVDKTKLKKELFAVYASENRFEKFYKTLESAPGNRVEVWGGYEQGEDYKNLDGRITKEEAKRIVEIYKKELSAIGEDFYSEEKQTKSSVASITLYIDGADTFGIYTTEDFSETNEILRSFQPEAINILE